MAKPWAKLEQNYINHPKFLALPANAICLWHEGKNYCDVYQTDGMIPRQALKTFRFNGLKGVEALTRSCGLKPNSEPYAPLWEALDIGGVAYFRIHDYLLHNDSRDEVLARIEDADDQAELRRAANKERQRKFREERKARVATLRNNGNALRHGDSNGDSHAEKGVTSHTPTDQKQKQKQVHALSEHVSGGVTDRSKRPIFSGQRLTVFEWMLDRCLQTLGPLADDFDLHAWFFALDEQAARTGMVIPPRDGATWLLSQLMVEARRRGLPIAIAEAQPTAGKLTTRMAAMVENIRREEAS